MFKWTHDLQRMYPGLFAKWKTGALISQLKENGCSICGYAKCAAALDFHHVNPEDKKFQVVISTRNVENILREVQKCILLCSNCHREIHNKERKL